MHKYCLDTSGLSTPVLQMPEDLYISLWGKVIPLIQNEVFCWNREIGNQLASIRGKVGQALLSVNKKCCYEIDQTYWPWKAYLDLTEEWRETKYHQYISEYHGGRKNTIDIPDLSIVALAKILNKPIVSMENPNYLQSSTTRMRIPALCEREKVVHLDFNGFLRAEKLTI